jgi:hypothetical protein
MAEHLPHQFSSVCDGTADPAFSRVQAAEGEAASRDAHKETTMYHLDPNINAAIERQAHRVRAVRAYGSNEAPELTVPTWAGHGARPTYRVARNAILALAAIPPIVLIFAVAALMTR